jgi:hypothetical protein
MTDPERILDRPPSELSRTLLRAGTDEAPSDRSLRRTLAAVGVSAAALGTASSAGAFGAAKVASSVTVVTLTKWAGMGAVGGIVVAAAAFEFEPPARKPSVTPQLSAVSAPRLAPATVEPPPVPSDPAPVLPESEPAQRRPAVAPVPAPELEAPLAAEVAFVDRGRAAFQRGQPAAALAALAGYEREFRDPRLLPEVLYLRMEAMNQGGDRARATELGWRILRDYPRSPHAARARAIASAE